MPRPSLKTQRSKEILDAYMTCVARFGLEGATQERIAAEAGIKRPLLRHYLGNRDQMIAELNAHVAESFNALTTEFDMALTQIETSAQLIEILFAEDKTIDPRLMLAWQALTASAGDHTELSQQLLDSLSQFLSVMERTLRRIAPEADAGRVRAVTQGISAAFQTLESVSPLKPPAIWRSELKLAATLLTKTLERTE
ncbi:TetR/AcrR family transcriptional regulator [Ruegeria lacuscaerulensis]|uniref:TetR/AcrR family transcriptional regulator n=1 Tax=Ruegeria lacuscaerulensis TaxID=55218 RepID=UPI00147AE6F8|nr:TetR/AcrR family transcriptional regulator [Ruegeria lacuscaerulensis]